MTTSIAVRLSFTGAPDPVMLSYADLQSMTHTDGRFENDSSLRVGSKFGSIASCMILIIHSMCPSPSASV